jgi:membrane protein
VTARQAASGHWLSAILATFRQIKKGNLGLISAGVAFFTMLSLFPALAALVAILSLIADPAVVIAQLEEVQGLMPEEVYRILKARIVSMVSTSSNTLGWAGVLSISFALFSARAGVGALMQGLNAVYGQDNRGSLRHFLRAVLLTISLVAVGIVALLALVVAPLVLAFIPLGAASAFLADALRWTIAVAVIFAGIGLLYRFGPNRTSKGISWVTPGSIFAATSWALVSIAFSYYVANFGNYNEIYGSIGAVIAMLIWLWISSFLVLLGAALNAELEARRLIPEQAPHGPDSESEHIAAAVSEVESKGTNEAVAG